MRQSNNRTSKLMIFGVILGDLILMNTLFTVLYHLWINASKGSIFSGGYWEMVSFNTLCYIASTYYNGVVLHLRKTKNLSIINKVTVNCLKFAFISIAFITLAGYGNISTRFLVLFHLINYIILIIWRISCHKLVLNFRSHGRNASFQTVFRNFTPNNPTKVPVIVFWVISMKCRMKRWTRISHIWAN